MTKIIAEIGINHDGNFQLAKKLIDISYQCQSWGVKFQYRNINNYFKNNLIKQKEIGKEIIDKEIIRNYISPNQIIKISEYAKRKNLKVGISFFSAEDIKDFNNYKFDFYKIPSSVSNDVNLIKKLSNKKKLLIISLGAHSKEMIDNYLKYYSKLFDNPDTVLMHCVSNYPLHPVNAQLNNIDYLKKKLQFSKIGYSSHDSSIGICIYSLSKNIDFLERHITISKQKNGLDHSSSSDPEEFNSLCFWANNIKRIDNKNANRFINSGEKNNFTNLSKSFYAKKDIKKNEILTLNKIYSSFPFAGVRLEEINKYINKKVVHAIKKNNPIMLTHLKRKQLNTKNLKNFCNKNLISLPVRPFDYKKIQENFKTNSYELHLSYNDLSVRKLNMFNSEFLKSSNISIHVPDYCDQHNVIDVFSSNKKIKQKSIRIFRKCFNFARYISNIKKKKIYLISSFSLLEKLDKNKFYKKISNFIKKNNSKYYELLPQWLPAYAWYFGGSVKIHAFCDPRDIVFIRKYKINLCLDVSHFILSCNYFKLNKDIFFDKLNLRSKHYHISDGSSVDEEGKLFGNGDLLKTKILNKIFHDKKKIKVLETWQGHLNECLFFKNDLNFLKKKFSTRP